MDVPDGPHEDVPEVTHWEINFALHHMNRGKTPGPDAVLVDQREYLNHLRFADDIVIISETKEQLQGMLHVHELAKESETRTQIKRRKNED